MEIAGVTLALLGFLAATWVWFRSVSQQQKAQAREAELQEQLEKTQKRAKKAETEASTASNRVRQLEKDLAEAVARRDEKAMAAALWELELERSYRQWRDVVLPAEGATPEAAANGGQQLAFAISQEVERLRDEVGVSIRFDGGLDLALEPETALAALRVAEELLAMAAKAADEVTVSLDQGDEPSVALTLQCNGWQGAGGAEQSEVGVTIRRMAERLDGWVRWTVGGDEGDEATVVMRLPAPVPEPAVETDVEPEPAASG